MKKNVTRLAALILSTVALSAHAATEWSTQDYDLYAGDFNGDGYTDLLYVAKDPAKPSGIAVSDGNAPNVPFQSWPSNYLGLPWHNNQYLPHVADFNGDGKADILMQRSTAGDSYLLLADANGKITATHQTIPYSHLGQYWSADKHKIVTGDFSGDGKADLFLQATSPSDYNAVFIADSSGQFTISPQTWTDSTWAAFKWSTRNSNIVAGDFNGDGNADLLVQAKPNIVMIDYDIPIPVPTYQPNTFGVVLSQGGASPMQQVGVQQWSRNAHGVDWSPNATNIVVGNFNGSGGADVLLQARNSSRPSYILYGQTSGAVFASATSVSANVTITGDGARLIAGNFDGGSAVGVYIQTTSPGGDNYVANAVGASISASYHSPAAATGVVPATAVGHTVGSFAASNSGAATYSIPVVVPPGVAGLQPSLSINYQSSGGNGPLGIGWDLGGFSEIERCGKTLAQDNSNDTVALTSADRFCLDGNKLRLTGGSYGAAGSTYETEIATFSRVTAYSSAGNGPAYFMVEGKDGLIYEYGNSSDSRIEAINSTASTTARAWALNKVSDRHGNTMTITYEEDGAPNGSYRPSQISYTSNSNAGLSAAYRVVFIWDARPAADILSGYYAGGLVKETKRLNRIETQYNDPSVGTWRLVRKYQLSYNGSSITKRSRLASVQECDRYASCLSPTLITWQDGQAGWSSSEALSGSASAALIKHAHAIDIDGDGITDLVYPQASGSTTYWFFMRGTSTGAFTAPVNSNINAGDATNLQYAFALPINAFSDGRFGLLTTIPGYSQRQVLRWNGSTLTLSSTNLTAALDGRQWTADLDGDGLDDFAYALTSGGTGTVYVQKNNGSATFATAQAWYSASTLAEGLANPWGDFDLTSSRIIDANGDGRVDILLGSSTWGYYTNEVHFNLLLSTGSGFAAASTYQCFNCFAEPMMGDLNGDGLTDFMFGGGWQYQLMYGSNAGSGWVAGPTVTLDSLYSSAWGAPAPVRAVDYDGDGRQDFLYLPASGSSWNLLRFNGQGFDAPVSTTIPYTSSNFDTVRLADFTGDGQIDVGYQNGAFRVRSHNGSVADLASAITDGFGNNVTVTYAPLTDSAVYTKGSGAPTGQIDLQVPMYVVKEYSASDGIGGSYTVTEKYAGLRAALNGRGMLGFASRESIDSRTGIKSTWTFRQDHPFIGFVSQASTYQSASGALIAQTTNTPDQKILNATAFNDRRYPYLQQSVQENYEVGGPSNALAVARVTTTNTLDNNGNPTNVSSTTLDLTGSGLSYTSSTSNTYADATCAWRGFATQQQMTNTVPNYSAQTRTVQFIKDSANPNACRVYQEIVEPGNSAVSVTTTIGYDSFGNPNSQSVSAANIETRTTSTSYGSQGVFPVSITQSVSSTFSQAAYKTYDYALGVPLTATDPNTLQTVWTYDGFGRLEKETRPDLTKTTWTYSACGIANNYCGDSRLRYQVQKTELDSTTPGNVIRSSTQRFDAFGRSLYDQSQTLSGAVSTVATNYDNQGRVYQRSAPYFTGYPAYFTTIAYDLIGRVVSETRRISEADSGNQSTTYGYNRLVHTQTDANGKTTTKQFNAIGQVIQVTDAASGVTTYEYDQFANLRKTTDPANNQIINTFNIRGFKTSTSDPDMGYWSYTYYPTGELWTQTDAKSQVVTFTYDRVSRPKTRQENEGTTTFNYGESQGQRNIGKLASVYSPGAYSESYTYDTLGRLQDATTNADATSFVVSNSYSGTTGFLETVTYPASTSAVPNSRFKVKYEYDNGLLKRVRDFNTPATIYWEQVATNAAGQPVDEQLGNGLHTYSTYDGITGLLGARSTGTSAQIQNLTYQWDKVGNLTQRKDNALSLTEDFYYDNLYRLDYSRLNGVTTPNLDVSYNAAGNITSMTGVGTYTYPTSSPTSVRPHAVTAAGSNSYSYDANGNMTTRNGSTITWFSYNLPNRIDKGSSYAQFYYGADRARYKQVAYTASGGSLPTGTETTIYVSGLFEKVTKSYSSVTEYKHYIMAGKEAVAIRTLRTNSTADTRYLHKDHLGSVDAITNESGTLVDRFSYDAFGKRRNATSWSGGPASGTWTTVTNITHRGFTFHEHLDNVDLVHMNGRVYDPLIGRFISADPFIQAPLMSQSLNRYSYVINNPLSLIDPSGYSWLSKALRSIRRGLHAALRFHVAPTPKNFFESIKAIPGQKAVDRYVMSHEWAYKVGYAAAVVSTWWIGGYGGAVYQSYYTYLATGSTTKAVMAGVAAAWQQYMSNYFYTGSGFQMPNSGGSIVLSWEGGATGSAGGPNLWGIFLSAYLNAPTAPLPVRVRMNGGTATSIPDLVSHIHQADMSPAQKYAALTDFSTAITQFAENIAGMSTRAMEGFLAANGENRAYAIGYRTKLYDALTMDASIVGIQANFYIVQSQNSALKGPKVKPPTGWAGGAMTVYEGVSLGTTIWQVRSDGNSFEFELCPSKGCAN